MILSKSRLLLLFQFVLVCNAQQQEGEKKKRRKRIAVIGGGVAGSFATKYLVDYDTKCEVESITVFEPYPVTRPLSLLSGDAPNDDWQASRVSSFELREFGQDVEGDVSAGEERAKTIVELGASIGFKEFHHVLEMIRADPNLRIGSPQNLTSNSSSHNGIGVYDGNGWWPILTSKSSRLWNKFYMLYRYNFDLFKLLKTMDSFLFSFAKVPELLKSSDPSTFFESPEAIWQAVGLSKPVHSSMDDLLGAMGVPATPGQMPWWRQLLPWQGCIGQEFLEPINLNNYNQDNAGVNGLVGLGSFAASQGGTFSIVGGNYQVIKSAFEQARFNREQLCQKSADPNKPIIAQVEKRVTTVVASSDGHHFTLYGGQDSAELLGIYDVVILAAPLQFARIKFLVQSRMDEAVLQPMHLGSKYIDSNMSDMDSYSAVPSLSQSSHLPDSAMRPYTQVITTIVSNATLTSELFSLPDSSMPRFILMTSKGKAAVHNITTITQLAPRTYKVFSNDILNSATMTKLFGADHHLQYVKAWGGQHGGATPDYQGQGVAASFVLYDGTVGGESEIDSSPESGALYYACAMEQSTLASMELAAIGAKAAAKLTSRRLGLLITKEKDVRDEL